MALIPVTGPQPVVLYDSSNTEIAAPPVGSYTCPVNIRQTTTTTAGGAAGTVWYLNAVGVALYIRRAVLSVGFDGTAATNTVRYSLARFGTAVCSAGTAIVPTKKKTSYSASSATAGFVDTGVTTTNVVFAAPFATLGCPISVTSKAVPYHLNFITPGQKYSDFVIAAGEGLAIYLDVTGVVGQTISGYIEYDERAS